jgi:hypothetical protein
MGVVKEWENHYPRGTKLVYEILGIDARGAAAFVAHNDKFWPKLRILARYFESCYTSGKFVPTASWGRANLRQNPAYKSNERLMQRLDMIEMESILKEQGKQGGAEGAQATEAPFLTSSVQG